MKYENNPVMLLREMASKAVDTSNTQISRKDLKNIWSGVGFSLCGHSLVAPMGEVIEIAPVPEYTLVPGTKPWALGIANVRGRLLPIVDLECFFGSRLAGNRRNYRVLITEINKVYVGLVVNKVFGLQHFEEAGFVSPDGSRIEAYGNFIDAEYPDENRTWYRFLPSRLLEDREFADASLLGSSGRKTAANVA